MMLTVESLREIFTHDPVSGFLYWKVSTGARSKVGGRAGMVKLVGKQRYLTVGVLGAKPVIHKIIWALHYGQFPTGEIDHINGNREDNSIGNLRDVSRSENNRNARPRIDNKSGIRGVCWNNKKQRWIVQIGLDRKVHQVGGYMDFFDACCSRKSAEIQLGYHANHGRHQPC